MFGSFEKKKKSTIVINYKSGRQVRLQAKSFIATRNGSELTKLEYEGLVPTPLFFGLDEIESIWEEK